jgi:hypothetical protein
LPQPPELEYLFSATINLRPNSPVLMNAPQGSRVIVTVGGGIVDGPKLRGTVDPSGGDWVTLRPDGSFKLDVRALIHTDDGANIFMRYEGIGVRADGTLKLVTAPLFETGDERYAWLNNVQAIATGASANDVVTYDVYAARHP